MNSWRPPCQLTTASCVSSFTPRVHLHLTFEFFHISSATPTKTQTNTQRIRIITSVLSEMNSLAIPDRKLNIYMNTNERNEGLFLGVWCSNGGKSTYFTCCANKLMISIVSSRTPDWSWQSSALYLQYLLHVQQHIPSGSVWFFFSCNFQFRGRKRRNFLCRSEWILLCLVLLWHDPFCV